ncbi:unnamed protein product [Paramecium primaurelia]|uniref:Uncharacterized protein n=1 Tax=Paramecium primaurelia TaxID=5886 RepID=A0A8S1M9V1_PARPR|nr:unnamed protein product [Paramecium primaurelia]
MEKVICLWSLNQKVIISFEHTLLVYGKYVGDHKLSSFIFSQTHINLQKYDAKQYAIYFNSNYGPSFGNEYDIKIGSDFTKGYSKLDISYSFSNFKYGHYDLDLFGQIKPEIKECQIYESQLG